MIAAYSNLITKNKDRKQYLIQAVSEYGKRLWLLQTEEFKMSAMQATIKRVVFGKFVPLKTQKQHFFKHLKILNVKFKKRDKFLKIIRILRN